MSTMSTETESKESQEMTLVGGQTDTTLYAVGVILAAVYAVSGFIPISAFLGSAGPLAQLTLTICIAPLFGILLGPYRGFLFGLVAGLITAFLPGISLFVPTVIIGPAISGFLTGLCLKPRTRIGSVEVPGPLLTALYLIAIMILYLIPNSSAWWFMIYYGVAAVIAVSLQFSPVIFDSSKKGFAAFLQVIPLTLIGTMTDFSMMTMGAVYLLDIPAFVFGTVIFPFMLAERSAATIISAIVASLVLVSFRNLSWGADVSRG
ncbi:MAG: hypothetical protein ACFE7R_07490 [Candidatus Hodarchaeota archaeon]